MRLACRGCACVGLALILWACSSEPRSSVATGRGEGRTSVEPTPRPADSALVARLAGSIRAKWPDISARDRRLVRELDRTPRRPPIDPSIITDIRRLDEGKRVTAAAGLLAISQISTEDGPLQAACVIDTVVRALIGAELPPEPLRSRTLEAACWKAVQVSTSFQGRIEQAYARQRQSEIELAGSFLWSRARVGSPPLSADEERAIMYLERLARAVQAGDGEIGIQWVLRSRRAAEFRDRMLAAGTITQSLREELAARAQIARWEAEWARNLERGRADVASKHGRTQAQWDSVRRDICASFGNPDVPSCRANR